MGKDDMQRQLRQISKEPFSESIQRQMEQLSRISMVPFRESMQRQMEQMSRLSMTPFRESIQRQMEQMSRLSMTPFRESIQRQMEQMSKLSMTPFRESMQRQMEQMSRLSYIPLIESVQKQIQELSSTSNAFLNHELLRELRSLDEYYNNYETNISFDDITFEETCEVNSDINLIMEDAVNWQQKLCIVLVKWKAKNPAIAWIINYIIIAYIVGLMVTFSITAMTKKDSYINESPQFTSQVVNNIEINQTVNIIDDAPYYYKIEFVNEETNQKKIGWISKRDLQIIENLEEEKTVK